MKKFLAIAVFSLALFAAPVISKAQTTKWPFGAASVSSYTATTLVPSYSFTPLNTLHVFNITVDTSLVINFTNVKVQAGSIVHVKVTNNTDAAVHTVTGNTKCTMKSFTLTSAKTHMFTFVYDGTNYINTGGLLIN